MTDSFTLKASWPSAICPEAGLHAWTASIYDVSCDWCGQSILREDCAAYQVWANYWLWRLCRDPEMVLN